jgi:hypothetical protein
MGKLRRLFDKFNSAISKDYSRLCRNEIYRAMYETLAHTDREVGVSPDSDANIIVSLTTYGERIYTVHKTIESIMRQTHRANRIILWLDQEEFTLDTVPLVLMKMIDRGLEIKFCPNYKSYKKLIPTLEIANEGNIITVDDDMIYPLSMIENMYRTHLKHPDCVIFNYGTEITFNKDGQVLPYVLWTDSGDFTTPSYLYMGIGVGGILYPAGSLHGDVMDVSAFTDLAPRADDLWFKVMSFRNGTKQVQTNYGPKVLNTNDFLNQYITIEDVQRERLGTANVINSENDIQLLSLMKAYNVKFN